MGKTHLTIDQQVYNTMVAAFKATGQIEWRVADMVKHLNESIHNSGRKFTSTNVGSVYSAGAAKGKYTKMSRGAYAITRHLEESTAPSSKGGEIVVSETVQGEIVDTPVSTDVTAAFNELRATLSEIHNAAAENRESVIESVENSRTALNEMVKDLITTNGNGYSKLTEIVHELRASSKSSDVTIEAIIEALDKHFETFSQFINKQMTDLTEAWKQGYREGYKEGREDENKYSNANMLTSLMRLRERIAAEGFTDDGN